MYNWDIPLCAHKENCIILPFYKFPWTICLSLAVHEPLSPPSILLVSQFQIMRQTPTHGGQHLASPDSNSHQPQNHSTFYFGHTYWSPQHINQILTRAPSVPEAYYHHLNQSLTILLFTYFRGKCAQVAKGLLYCVL